jgi:hypothetical protein
MAVKVSDTILLIPLLMAVQAPSAGALDLSNLAPNRWHAVQPAWHYPPGLGQGAYQGRGWGTLRAIPARGTVVFYEGFGPSRRGHYCIYANALYEFDPATERVDMLSIGNWYCQSGSKTLPLPENEVAPTPKDRHTYAQFAYAPTTDRVYLAAGASSSGGHPFDFWSFSLSSRRWERLGDIPAGIPRWGCICEGNLIWNSGDNRLYLFVGANPVYAFDLKDNSWKTVATKGTARIIGSHGTYDARRNRFVFYGNNWTADERGSDAMVIFDVATATWSNEPLSSPWPPAKSYASLEYNEKHDAYMLHGGRGHNDTWAYFPARQGWTRIESPTRTAANSASTYFAYDSRNDILINFAGQRMWVMRWVP